MSLKSLRVVDLALPLIIAGLIGFSFVLESNAQVDSNTTKGDAAPAGGSTNFGDLLPKSNSNDKITVYLHRCTNIEKYDVPKMADITRALIKENFGNVKPG